MRHRKISFSVETSLHEKLESLCGGKRVGEYLTEMIEESLEYKKIVDKSSFDDQAILFDIMKNARAFIETAPHVLSDNIFLKKIRENIELLNSGEIKIIDDLNLDILPPRSSFQYIATLSKPDVSKMKLESCLSNDVVATNLSVFLEKPMLVRKTKFSLEHGEKFLVAQGKNQFCLDLSFRLYKVI